MDFSFKLILIFHLLVAGSRGSRHQKCYSIIISNSGKKYWNAKSTISCVKCSIEQINGTLNFGTDVDNSMLNLIDNDEMSGYNITIFDNLVFSATTPKQILQSFRIEGFQIRANAIFLLGIDAIDLSLTFNDFKVAWNGPVLHLGYSHFRPSLWGKKIDQCDFDFWNRSSPINGYSLYSLSQTRYYEDTCLLLFAKSLSSDIVIQGIQNSLIRRNILGFEQVTESNQTTSLNSSFDWIKIIYSYGIDLNRRLLHPQILNSTRGLILWGVFQSVEKDLWQSFDFSCIFVFPANTRQFLLNNPNWLENLHIEGKRKNSRIISIGQNDVASHIYSPMDLKMSRIYQFSNADFCAFINYPVKKSDLAIVLSLQSGALFCSCTILWVIQNDPNVDSSIIRYYVEANWFSNTGCSVNNHTIEECQFTQRVGLCKLNNFQKKRISQFSSYDLIFTIDILKLTSVFFLQPIICILGVLLNFINIIILRIMGNSKRGLAGPVKTDNRPMYAFFRFHSFCSLFTCGLFAGQMLIECIAPFTKFCFSLFTSDSDRLYYLLGLNYFGNVLKTCSNITIISFSLHRYLLNNQKLNNPLVKRFKSISPSRMMSYVFALACFWASIRIFINERITLSQFVQQKDFLYLQSVAMTFDSKVRDSFLNLIYITNIFFNDVLAIIINLYIDYKLLKFSEKAKQELKIKLAKNKPQIKNENEPKKKTKNEKTDEEGNSRLSKMIIVNGFVTFLLRFPDLTISMFRLYVNIFPPDVGDYCVFTNDQSESICPNLYLVSQTIYLANCLVPFFLFYKFDTNFKRSFVKLFKRK
nr:G protein-coupled receptor [Proales similis]